LRRTERVGKLAGKSTRIGVYKCYDCRKPFTVKVGTIFESSHIPMRLWLQAIFLIASSKKGISSNQLHRTLGITLKFAWFMTHRIREAMKEGGLEMFGQDGGVVEVDETFIGRDFSVKPKGEKRGRGYAHKSKVLSLVDRQSGRARSIVVDNLKASTLYPIIAANVAREARLMTTKPRSTNPSARRLPTTAQRSDALFRSRQVSSTGPGGVIHGPRPGWM
jgi:transposase-like protein